MGNKTPEPAARVGDIASNHGPWPPTPITGGSPDTFINGIPAARQGDPVLMHAIPNHPPHGRSLSEGTPSVLINGKPAARVSDAISCGGKVSNGSPNVFIGDNPQLSPKLSGNTPPTPNPTESPLAAAKQDAIDTWQRQKDQADNFPEFLAAHLMMLNAEAGYSIAEGLTATFATVTDPDQFKAVMCQLKDSAIDTITDPVNTYWQVKQAAIDFSNLSLSEQGDAAYKAMVGALAGGGMAKGAGVVGKVANTVKKDKAVAGDNKHSDEDHSGRLAEKKYTPDSLPEAQARLMQRRQQINAAGYQPKYTDSELAYMARHGNVASERFQVRFMETKHLTGRDTPTGHLSGAMGITLEGTRGKGAKYWSTSFDQIEDADTDPKLIAQKLGVAYNPGKNYALVIVDTEKAAPLTGVISVPATFDEVGRFATTELPSDFPETFTEKAMTPAFQADYARYYQAAVKQKHIKDWSTDSSGFEDYLKTTGMDQTDIDEMKLRMLMHKKIGNNHEYLGNGLTKDLNPGSLNQYGAVETLNFERREVNLRQLHEAHAITVIPGLRPL
jgi:uncharacterized Zn-binding protein involved in type VI secretion